MAAALLPAARPVAARRAPGPARATSEAAPPPAQKIRIKLKSFDTARLVESADLVVEAAKSSGASVSGPVPLPTRRRIYTVLRSPHVNKDSREQFETRTHSRLVYISDPTAETVDGLMKLQLPAGVDVEVKV